MGRARREASLTGHMRNAQHSECVLAELLAACRWANHSLIIHEQFKYIKEKNHHVHNQKVFSRFFP